MKGRLGSRKRSKAGAPTRIVRRTQAYVELAALKKRRGREILVFGSHVLWNDLLAHGLVDELHLMIGAGVLVEGVRAFDDGSSLLRLGTPSKADIHVPLLDAHRPSIRQVRNRSCRWRHAFNAQRSILWRRDEA